MCCSRWSVACAAARCEPADPRLKEIWYDPHEVVTVLVKRGVVTHVVLDADESITDVGSEPAQSLGHPIGITVLKI